MTASAGEMIKKVNRRTLSPVSYLILNIKIFAPALWRLPWPAPGGYHSDRRNGRLLMPILLAILWAQAGCIARVHIPPVDQFTLKSTEHTSKIDVSKHAQQLLSDLYLLMKANDGEKVPICTASKDHRRCIKDGVRVFVQGGVIPGTGKRTTYGFSNITLSENRLDFTKDNSGTTFIGTPMHTRPNACRVYVKNGGLQVEMDKYYANWAGIGNMFMAEGWAIDYLDLEKGIVGLQLELDIAGYLTLGGGSSYVLLEFPRVPESLPQSESKYDFLKMNLP